MLNFLRKKMQKFEKNIDQPVRNPLLDRFCYNSDVDPNEL